MLKEKLKQTNSLEVFSGIGILLFLVGCPYFLTNRYYSMTLAKTLFFFGSSAFFAVGCLILRRRLKKRVVIPLVRKNNTERFFLLFCGLAVVSCVLADNPTEAFIGSRGRNMGLMMFLFIFLAYIFVSRFGQLKTGVAVVFGASLIVMNLIAFLQFCRLDPFHLYEGTKKVVKIGFMTMLGNKDVYYSYLALSVPFALYLNFEAEKLWEKIFWYAVSWTGFVGILICNCEGGYICLPIVFLFFLLFKCRDKESVLVFLRLVMLLLLACLLVSCLRENFDKGDIEEELLTRLFLHPAVYGVGLPVTAALYWLAMKKELAPGFLPALKKTVGALVAVGAAGAAGAFVYFSFINRTAEIGRLGVLLRFDGAGWGSGRGAIWKNMAVIYARYPILDKLFGAGEESIAASLETYLPEVAANSAKVVDNAHNEYLHYLLTHGLLGLIAYLLFVVSAVRRGFREGGRYQRAAALGACCYLAQASFNLLQGLTTPMFFVFLALSQTKDVAVPKKSAALTDVPPEADGLPEEDAPAPLAPTEAPFVPAEDAPQAEFVPAEEPAEAP